MIISASRRTDIPAFYAEWFRRRLEDGKVFVRSPFRPSQIRIVSLNPEEVTALVFWTKNPAPMIPVLDRLRDYAYYFLFTLTAYGPLLEQRVPDKTFLLNTFFTLSDRIGPHRMIWRYDPILLTEHLTPEAHYRRFERLSQDLKAYTTNCVISFLSLYRKCRINLKSFVVNEPDDHQKKTIVAQLAEIARAYNIKLSTCAEPFNFSPYGIEPARCIDPVLIRRISHKPVDEKKDPYQRQDCHCAPSVDIGAYHTCLHGCLFCYANHRPDTAVNYYKQFSPDQEML